MIIFLRSTNETFWFPLYEINDLKPDDLLFYGTFEIVFLILAGFFALRTCWIILKVRIFHQNMSIMLTSLWILWIETAIAKLIIFPYQFSLIILPGSSNNITWWTSKYEKMMKIDNFEDISMLFVASFLLWHYCYSAFVSLLVTSLERILATYYIE
ncbi:unnamed protein product [Caenorhabditis angaria]|uniref:Uncharacterized protein n=1 Tax=Caenorhabditis angaria TaxID=860376 RepID=A0A9P1IE71_9PELO|nr:unnamed protein product [Caenorhabditis angaria]